MEEDDHQHEIMEKETNMNEWWNNAVMSNAAKASQIYYHYYFYYNKDNKKVNAVSTCFSFYLIRSWCRCKECQQYKATECDISLQKQNSFISPFPFSQDKVVNDRRQAAGRHHNIEMSGDLPIQAVMSIRVLS